MIDIFSRVTIGREASIAASGSFAASSLPALALAKSMAPDGVLEFLKRSGLAGKGGANFPTHRKVELMRTQQAPEKYLVVNGGEHEPGSNKDCFLLEEYPQTVLEGALILAHAADVGVVRFAVKESAVGAIAKMRSALDHFGCNDRVGARAAPLVIVDPIPDAYLVGEESALIGWLDGRPAVPRLRPPFPIESGLNGLPTLVQNVETVAHLPYIIAAGPERYRDLGNDGAGATLCTFGPEFAKPGVRLVPLGISLRDLVFHYGGGLQSGKRVKAVQPGGPAAGLLSEAELDVRFEESALKRAGSALGCAAIRALAIDDDVVQFVAGIMKFFADGSCGQCPPCRMETQMLASIMAQVVAQKGTDKLLKQIPLIIKSATAKPAICSLIRMPVAPITTALAKFGGEFEQYLAGNGKSQTPVASSIGVMATART